MVQSVRFFVRECQNLLCFNRQSRLGSAAAASKWVKFRKDRLTRPFIAGLILFRGSMLRGAVLAGTIACVLAIALAAAILLGRRH